jgi:pimeloyl-ACP methyl ester carboxylesterase
MGAVTTTLQETLNSNDYDEFGLLHLNAAEWDLPFEEPPAVSRRAFELPSGQSVSYLRWGDGDPELVFLHGAAQNAHTWDTVMLALGFPPTLAVDLPGHGHSDWRPDRDYGPWRNAETVAALLEDQAPSAKCIVGMSNGGASVIRLAAQRPELCRRALLVDVTPQVYHRGMEIPRTDRGAVALVMGPPIFDSFDDIAAAAVAQSPLRPAAGVRLGVRHNARRLEDGRWTWRYDRFRAETHLAEGPSSHPEWFDFTPLWEDVSGIEVPTLLVRGGESPYVVDEDAAKMKRLLPSLDIVVVAGAGHAVQSDRPLELAAHIRRFAYGG